MCTSSVMIAPLTFAGFKYFQQNRYITSTANKTTNDQSLKKGGRGIHQDCHQNRLILFFYHVSWCIVSSRFILNLLKKKERKIQSIKFNPLVNYVAHGYCWFNLRWYFFFWTLHVINYWNVWSKKEVRALCHVCSNIYWTAAACVIATSTAQT